MEENRAARWWASPSDWVVPELGFGDPVTFELQAARIDPQTEKDPPSSLPADTVVAALRKALQTCEPVYPRAASADEASE